ncbi:cation diffusion facilitator family transporter [Alsobacter sp. SYSU M60028]|uniref:Cation diffusion facilitator family transporter n=1 Tax=Alsobacter ponti TaxID=2962936 RepID=A0ABT1L7K4_9HYPH|nr:cation diffusion facilitator family transporter [Alsobacter ponti]MCP8937450.1 cation diffusion facilitator family transporter [Alsobacter ponti]
MAGSFGASQTRAAPGKHPNIAVYAALVGNLLVAATKFAAAAWTGSSSTLSEAFHSLVDTVNEVLLLYGIHRSRRPPDPKHTWGHGREIYFWSFVVAILVFAAGAGVSAYEGVQHLRAPELVEDPFVVYAVLALSLAFESASWVFAWRQFRSSNRVEGLLAAIRRSKDPATFTVLLEDSAAVIGLLIALASTAVSQLLEKPEIDAYGSLAISVLLAAVAALLARETKGLLIGEPADRTTTDLILRIANEEPGVVAANGVLTTHLGPDQVTASLSIEFEDGLRTPDIERAVSSIESKVRQEAPSVVLLFVKPQTPGAFDRARAAWFVA